MTPVDMSRAGAGGDARLRGFLDRATMAQAARFIDAQAARLGTEAIDVGDALGRVLSGPLTAPADLPAVDRAAVDGPDDPQAEHGLTERTASLPPQSGHVPKPHERQGQDAHDRDDAHHC